MNQCYSHLTLDNSENEDESRIQASQSSIDEAEVESGKTTDKQDVIKIVFISPIFKIPEYHPTHQEGQYQT